MKLVYHPHGGTVIYSEAETDRLMALTDPTLVHLLYDSGHVYYGDGDPIRIYKNHRKRIPYFLLIDQYEGWVVVEAEQDPEINDP